MLKFNALLVVLRDERATQASPFVPTDLVVLPHGPHPPHLGPRAPPEGKKKTDADGLAALEGIWGEVRHDTTVVVGETAATPCDWGRM